MAQDFANGARRKDSRKGSLRAEPRRASRRRDGAFHWGSFGAGITAGVALTLAGALLPEWWAGSATTAPAPPAAVGDPTPVTRFEFFERLPNESSASHTVTNAAIDAPVHDGPREFLRAGGVVHEQRRCRTLARDIGAIGLEYRDGGGHAVERRHPTPRDRGAVCDITGHTARDHGAAQAGRRSTGARAQTRRRLNSTAAVRTMP